MSITYKEMLETFNALEKTKNYLEVNWLKIEDFIKSVDRYVFVGCGSSYSNAKSFAMICSISTGVPALALAAGDILLHAKRYRKCIDGAAVVFISRSGRTSELIKAHGRLRDIGCSIMVASLVCADDTPLGDKSDLVLSTPWAFDESVCQTRCVTNAYFMAAYIAAKITNNTSVLFDLQSVITKGSAYLKKMEAFACELAGQPWKHAVILADAELEGIAEEGALVFKEVCRLPSSYHHLLDVRHGPMVLINNETLVLAALGTSCELEKALLYDLKVKGACVVAFSNIFTVPPAYTTDFDDIIHLSFDEPLSHIAKGIPFIVLCQMVAYYKSKETGADPDKPEGLDPWIAL